MRALQALSLAEKAVACDGGAGSWNSPRLGVDDGGNARKGSPINEAQPGVALEEGRALLPGPPPRSKDATEDRRPRRYAYRSKLTMAEAPDWTHFAGIQSGYR